MTRGMHRTTISRGKEATQPAFKKHFEDLLKRYGNSIYIVNLLGTKESEKEIADAFEEQLKGKK